jgi:flagellar motility protein MotE (MotC chaperone)
MPLPRLLPLTMVAMGASLLFHAIHLARGWFGTVPDQMTLMVPAARAAEIDKPAPAAPQPHPLPAADPPPAVPSPAPIAGPPPVSDSERALLQDLRARRGELDAKAAGVAEREAILAAAEKRLDARLNELTDLQHRLEQMDAARKQREEANWQGMVKLYETMKPRDAAAIFNDLEMPVLLPLLDRMKASKAALVLGAMQPERARQATAQLAQLRTARESVPPKPAGG